MTTLGAPHNLLFRWRNQEWMRAHSSQTESPPTTSPPGPWPLPPDPNIGVLNTSMDEDMAAGDVSLTHLPPRPTTVSPSSVFLIFLDSVIGNPDNCHGNGTVCLDPNSLGVIQCMMEAKSSCLVQMDKRMGQIYKALETLETRLQTASTVETSGQAAPVSTPPPQTVLKLLKPGVDQDKQTFVSGRESAGGELKGGFGFGVLSGHRRRIGQTRVVLEGAAGANRAGGAPGGREGSPVEDLVADLLAGVAAAQDSLSNL
ncbi:uncharacterized protein VP01_2354g3 [Puccinia sorghi]|uniref:Uncharacterized protein n=1 Tax=Puccinia sorghi TaxID=27349 RepID=A0A0L6V769_9BASI|nr:uncharacterized protein VP01_2354g3 [Puccinia sorghi]